MRRIWIAVLAPVLASCGAAPQASDEADREREIQAQLAAPRPIDAHESVWIDELTWMEVRDLIAAGTTTAIIATGGIEQNGPYLTTGKHNVILRAVCPAIARDLGNALCAPIIEFVPEGGFDPPSGAMRYPGTFSLRDETYRAVLTDVASSLRTHGFTDIAFIGDSGGNQRGMATVVEELNASWAGTGSAAYFIGEYYSPGWEEAEQFREHVLGLVQTQRDGIHDDIDVTIQMMSVDPSTVRHEQRVRAGLASINGVSIVDRDRMAELGRRQAEFRGERAADLIRAAMAARRAAN